MGCCTHTCFYVVYTLVLHESQTTFCTSHLASWTLLSAVRGLASGLSVGWAQAFGHSLRQGRVTGRREERESNSLRNIRPIPILNPYGKYNGPCISPSGNPDYKSHKPQTIRYYTGRLILRLHCSSCSGGLTLRSLQPLTRTRKPQPLNPYLKDHGT